MTELYFRVARYPTFQLDLRNHSLVGRKLSACRFSELENNMQFLQVPLLLQPTFSPLFHIFPFISLSYHFMDA